MAHQEQNTFFRGVKEMYPQYFYDTKVIEIGSLNINGTVRTLFDEPKEYIGLDLGEGPDVDIVCPGQDYQGEDNYFDVSISAECFEHNPYWLETMINMYRITKPDGLIAFTCASQGRAEHGTVRTSPEDSPFNYESDYYRNLNAEDFDDFIKDYKFKDFKFEYNPKTCDLYFWGIKPI